MKFSTLPSKSHMVARLLIVGAALASASASFATGIKNGSLVVSEPVSTPTLTLGPDTNLGISLPDGSNRGDYWFDLDFPNSHVLISSVTENGRDSDFATSSAYPSPSIAQRYFISIHQAVAGRVEDDINVAFAFFPLDEFLGGFASNGNTNGAALTALDASLGIELGTQLVENADDTYTLDLTGLGGSSDDGILLVNGAANREIYALSEANPDPLDETFTIYVHDNFENDVSYEQDQFSFVYIPTDHPSERIAAMGRIDGAGQSIISAGAFTVTNTGTGTWTLSIPSETNTSGTLIISPEGGKTRNVDNIWSYQWDDAGHWVIQSRDLTGLGLQALLGEPAFSFVFIKTAYPTAYVDAGATGNNNGCSWADAYTNLQYAVASPNPYEQILVAEGTYYPDSDPTDRGSSFVLKDGVTIEGGYPSGGGARDIAAHLSILSGDIDQNDTGSTGMETNSRAVVTAGFGVTSDTILSGFTITSGNADGPTDHGGGLKCIAGSPTIIACTFRANRSINSGGAIAVESGAPSFTNCAITGNFSADRGAAVSLVASSSTFTHCSIQGNASAVGGAVYSAGSGSSEFNNSIIWNNSVAGDSSSPFASLYAQNNTLDFSHCLIENWDATRLGDSTSLDGISDTDNNGTKDNDPRFLSEVDPANAPTLGGNLRLGANSPAVGVGNISQIPTSITTDLAGAPRIFGIGVDLGAYEAPDQLGAYITDARQTDPAGTPDGVSNWVPEFDTGAYTFDITPTSSLGTISFDDPPAARTGGALSFTLTAGTSGIASFQVIIRDSNNVLAPSLPYQFSIRSSDITWHVDQSAIGQADGASWENAFTSLDAALEIAFQGDQIWIAEGTYIPSDASGFTISADIDLFGGFPAGGGDGTFAARDPDPATNNTILSGDLDGDGDSTWPDPDNADHIITFTAGSIDGFTITRGNANGTGGAMNGGGIYSQGGDLKIQNVILINNHATTRGGGFYGSSVDVNMRNVIFDSNTSAGNGGGMHTAILPASAGFTNVILRNNHATNDGGGSYSAGEGGGTYTNCLFHDNSAGRDGGGSYSGGRSRNNYLNCTVANNTATRDYGGLRAEVDQGEPGDEEFVDDTLINTIVWGNSASNIPDTRATDFDRSISNHIGGDDPLFVNPSTNDYRLLRGSPAIDAGNNASNSEPTDLAGGPRRRGFIIDLGAYEGSVGATFALLHPNLDPDADDNGNGMSNYGDYAAGNDPTTTSPAPRPQLDSQLILTYSSRYNASDVESTLQKSFTLQPGSWSDLTRDEIDAISYTTFQGKGTQTSQLNFDPETIPRLFIRQLFFVPET